MPKTYDFAGWATKNNLLCSDGRTIRQNAFADNDGKVVPLVWNHQHNDPNNVLGHALLKNEPEGVRAYCTFNDTEQGNTARALVSHGDIASLSIWANQLKQKGGDVLHGLIREVSLVLSGANPGATIDDIVEHGDDGCSAIIYPMEGLDMYHADDKEEMTGRDNSAPQKAQTKDTADGGETIQDIFNTLTDKQKNAVYALVGYMMKDKRSAAADEDDDEDGGDDSMKHNVFENDYTQENTYLSHSDMEAIFADAKRCGSLKEAVENAIGEDGVLAHSIDTTGMETATGSQTYGFNDPSMLFPEYRSLNNPPEWLSREMGWVKKVMAGVHHTPFSRIKSVYADITEDDARARGYIKGKQKKEEVFTTLKRTTDPQTIYKKQKMDRDDIIDITDFDVVAWIRAEMRVMLDEEIARAILIGDGRPADSDDKIKEQNIRPIVKDVPLFNVKVNVDTTAQDDSTSKAKKTIDAVIRARKNYKGSGNPTFYTTEDVLTEMLLIEDQLGHKLYKTEEELRTALRVKEIVTVEPMEGYEVDDKKLIGVIVNLADYNVGADKGGQVNMFDDFDINYNQYKYLIETRMSGALIKPFSALTILENPQA